MSAVRGFAGLLDASGVGVAVEFGPVVRAIDFTTATERWAVEVGWQPTVPVVVDGLVHVGTSLGQVGTIGAPASD